MHHFKPRAREIRRDNTNRETLAPLPQLGAAVARAESGHALRQVSVLPPLAQNAASTSESSAVRRVAPVQVTGRASRSHEVIARKGIAPGDVLAALETIPFVKKKLSEGLDLRRDGNQGGMNALRPQVVEALSLFNQHAAGSHDGGVRQAMQLALVLENVARAVAVNVLNDPGLTPQVAVKLMDAYRSEIQKAMGKGQMGQEKGSAQLAQALVSDDPLALYMHNELRLEVAARRVRRMAFLAGKSPEVMFTLLQQKWEAQMGALRASQVANQEDKAGAYNVKGATGEVSSEYFKGLFGDVETPTWNKGGDGEADTLKLESGKQIKLELLGSEVANRDMNATEAPDEVQGLTTNQARHLDQVEGSDKMMDKGALENSAADAVAKMLSISMSQAATVLDAVKVWLASAPLTLTVQGQSWFGSAVPDAGKGETKFRAGSSRRSMHKWSKLLGKKKLKGEIASLGDFDDTTGQNRGKNYNRFRNWKDQVMTGRQGFDDHELPTFAAVNVNWDAASSQGTDAKNFGVNSYGDVHFKLRRANVAGRAIYTATDHGHPHRDPFLTFCDLLMGDGGKGATGLKDVKHGATAKHIINSALANKAVASSVQPFEVQIFGGLDVATDVEEIVVAPSASQTVKDNIAQFCKKNGLTFTQLAPKEVQGTSWLAQAANTDGLAKSVQAKV